MNAGRTACINTSYANEGSVSLESAMRVLNALGVLPNIAQALDPYVTDLGRARSAEDLPARVRPRDLTRSENG